MKKSKKGFTLIELLIVIALIAILISIVVPSLLSARDRARKTAFETQVKELNNAAIMFTLDYPNTRVIWSTFANTKAQKDIEITSENMHDTWNLYLDEWPQDPTREPESTFMVEIFENGDIQVSPDTPGGKGE
jgi:type IV pilus assembly protein PilA